MMSQLAQGLRGMSPLLFLLITAGVGFIWAMIGWSILMAWMWLTEKVEKMKNQTKLYEAISYIMKEVPREGDSRSPGEVFLDHVEKHKKAGKMPQAEVACPYCHLFLSEVLTLSPQQEADIIREIHEWRKA